MHDMHHIQACIISKQNDYFIHQKKTYVKTDNFFEEWHPRRIKNKAVEMWVYMDFY